MVEAPRAAWKAVPGRFCHSPEKDFVRELLTVSKSGFVFLF